ncbi:MAG: dihydrodipicolinate synthase family protein [Rhodospirillales bacterium]
MPSHALRGVIAPMLTPFNEDLSLAEDLFLATARRLLEEGCVGLAPFGTTGEALSVGLDERIAALQALVAAGIDPAKLIPGTGLNSLTDTARLTRACLDLGAAGALLLPPFYYKGVSDEGLYAYFARLIETLRPDRPCLYLYHIPQVAMVGLSPDLVRRLFAAFPEAIVGIKDSSGDWQNTQALLEIEGLVVYPGSEVFLLDGLKAGSQGCITATANINVPAISEIPRLFDAGKLEAAESAQARATAFRTIVQGYAPIPAQKRLLAQASGDPRWAILRPPLMSLPEAEGQALAKRLDEELDFRL